MATRWFLMALAAALLHAPAAADTLHLKDGKKLEGKIVEETAAAVVIDTRFGKMRIERGRIAKVERGLTPRESIEQRLAALGAADADGRVALAREARDQDLDDLYEQLVAAALRIDAQHKGANELLGRVLYQGRYVTPAERERLEREAQAEQMRAQGLVEYQGRWVTPEEKKQLEAGMVLRDGRWVPEAEAKAAEGLVLHEGQWIPREQAHLAQVKQELEALIGAPLVLKATDHVAVYSDVAEIPEGLAPVLEKGWKLFAAEFQLEPGLAWFGPRRADFFVFRARADYQKFIDWLGREKGMGAPWAARARDVVSIFRYEGWGLAATYLANRGVADVHHHMANQLGHVLLNSYRCEGRSLPPFLDDAYAALMEFKLLGNNLVFTRGSGRYERSLREDELRFFEDGNWLEPLRESMRQRADTPLEDVVRRDYGEMSQMDVGKGMALFLYLREKDGRVKGFIDALRAAWPAGNPLPSSLEAQRAVAVAVREATGLDVPPLDQELREYVMKRMKQ